LCGFAAVIFEKQIEAGRAGAGIEAVEPAHD
jgi:hypothetical protein